MFFFMVREELRLKEWNRFVVSFMDINCVSIQKCYLNISLGETRKTFNCINFHVSTRHNSLQSIFCVNVALKRNIKIRSKFFAPLSSHKFAKEFSINYNLPR